MVMRRPQAGFTMIEVMVAMLLTAIAIIGILALFMTQTKAAGFSRHATEGTALCEDKLEQLRTQISGAGSGTDAVIDEKGSAGVGIYKREWWETLTTTYADIVCKVSWTENGAPESTVLRGRRKL
jgi:prepilin-type N-terminal cleavage/methylation domain-containing protein